MTAAGKCYECDAITGNYDQYKKKWICEKHVTGSSRSVADWHTVRNDFYKKEKKEIKKERSPFGKNYF